MCDTVNRHHTHTTSSTKKRKNTKKEINHECYIKNRHNNKVIKSMKKSAVKRYQTKNLENKANHLKIVKKNQAVNPA